MKNSYKILQQQIREQIALEEHLCRIIDGQIEDIGEVEYVDYIDAKNLLKNTRQVLEKHFTPLNELLDKLDCDDDIKQRVGVVPNGLDVKTAHNTELAQGRISKILRDDYSALNLITISNTLLHTTALALNSLEIATIALQHLENLAPFVVRIGELMPEVITRELRTQSPSIDLSVAKTALVNTKQAWSKAS